MIIDRIEVEALIAGLRARASEGLPITVGTGVADALTALLVLAFDKDTGEKYIEHAAISEELRKEALARLSEVERERDDEHNALHDQIGHTFDAEARARKAEARLSEVEKALEQWKCSTCGGRGKRFLGYKIGDDGEESEERLYNEKCSACSGSGLNPIARATLQHKDQQG